MVVVVPVPAIAPGLITHVPVAGRPLNTTLPYGAAHDAGCVIVPIIGASTPGASFITTSAEGRDIHPASLVILKLYVPGTRFVIVALVPVPVIAPGLIIHVPVAGKPFNTTVPVDAAHEDGWVTVPTTGAVGATGGALITTSADGFEIHPAEAVTLKL